MWTCPLCDQEFVRSNQVHSCLDKTLADFFNGRSENTVSLFWHLVKKYQEIGEVTIHPTKTMIAFAVKTRIAYITKLGKDFIDVTFPFRQPYHDNLCFHKIAQVPGQQQFNHLFRMMKKGDVNEEVMSFMKMAYEEGK